MSNCLEFPELENTLGYWRNIGGSFLLSPSLYKLPIKWVGRLPLPPRPTTKVAHSTYGPSPWACSHCRVMAASDLEQV